MTLSPSLQAPTEGPKKDAQYWKEQIRNMEVSGVLNQMKKNGVMDVIYSAMMSSTWAVPPAPTTQNTPETELPTTPPKQETVN